MLIAGCGFFAFGSQLGRIFTSDEEVIALCGRIAFIVGLFEVGVRLMGFVCDVGVAHRSLGLPQIVDGIQGVTQGVLRGIGRQQLLAVLNFTAFWIVGVPSGYLLTFHAKLGVSGLWWGFSIGLGALAVFLVTSTAMVRWQDEVTKVHQRTQKLVEQ
jgi:MATE family multidrug resistance protein